MSTGIGAAQIPLWISSDPASGSINLSPDGSTFQINLSPPLRIPAEVKKPRIEMRAATVWFTFPNITATYTPGTPPTSTVNFVFKDAGNTYTIPFPTGLYSLQGFSDMLNSQIAEIYPALPANIFNWAGLTATQQTVMTVATGYAVDFTVASSAALASLLGFATVRLPAAGFTTQVTDFTGANQANFVQVTGLLIRCDGLGGGVVLNGKSTPAIAYVPITGVTGGIINYEPRQPIEVPLESLTNATINSLIFRLTDQNGAAVNTNGKFWSARFQIEMD